MKTKTIGIVLTKVSKEKIEGDFTKSKLIVELGELSQIEVRQELYKFPFNLNTETKIYTTSSFCDLSTSIKIGQELKKIGFENLRLLFNGEIREIEDY